MAVRNIDEFSFFLHLLQFPLTLYAETLLQFRNTIGKSARIKILNIDIAKPKCSAKTEKIGQNLIHD